jgi:uncharacterized protein YkwD
MNDTRGTTATRHHLVRRLTLVTILFAALTVGATACLPPPPAPPDGITTGVFNATNADRAANGIPTLGWNNQLAGLASNWAAHLAGANTGLVHQDLMSVLYSPGYQGYATLGENLLVGPQSMGTDAMEAAWRGSPGHWANIVRGNFTSVGVGYAYSNGKIWVAVEFGG